MRLSIGRLAAPFVRGGAWTPARLASVGTTFWWRGDTGLSLRNSGGTDYVEAWTDRLQGEELAIAASYQPAFGAAAFNGMPAVVFDNANANALDWSGGPPTLSGGAVTHLFVLHFKGPFTGNKYVLDSDGATGGHGWGRVSSSGSGTDISHFKRSSPVVITNWTTATAIDQPRAIVLVTNSADNRAYLDGGSDLLSSSFTDPLGTTIVRIGNYHSGAPTTTYGVTMDLAEWVVVDGTPSDADLDAFGTYVRARYGIISAPIA